MKRVNRKLSVLTALLCTGLIFNSFAADKAAPVEQKKEVKTIFSYKSELSLSDKQIQDIKDLLTNLQNFLIQKAKDLKLQQEELVGMIKNRETMTTIKAKLQKIAGIQVDSSYFDIDTSRKIEDVLLPTQLKKWREIQQQAKEKEQQTAKESTQKK